MRDSERRTHCLPMCNSFRAADMLAHSVRYQDPSISTTLVPCTFLPEFFDVLYAERNAKRVFKRKSLPSQPNKDNNVD